MRKGQSRILTLLGLLLVLGLVIILFTGRGTQEQVAQKETEMTKQEESKELKTAENEMYREKLTELKTNITELDQDDMDKFKAQTKDALNTIADLIDELPEASEETKKEVKENTAELKQAAEKIALFESEEKVVEQIKEGFSAANESIESALECEACTSKDCKNLCDHVDKKVAVIKDKSDKLDVKNHKQVTKEVLMDYYSLLGHMHKEMMKADTMAEADNAEQEISKKAKAKAEDGKDKKKEKSSCGCKLNEDHDKEHNKE